MKHKYEHQQKMFGMNSTLDEFELSGQISIAEIGDELKGL